jgi:hypothetical protein
MAEPFVGLALSGATPLINNYEKAWDPVKTKAQKMRERRKGRRKQQGDNDHEPTPEERGWVLKKRSEVQSDEEIVQRVPRNQQMVPYRPGINRRASSVDGNDYDDRRYGRNDRRVGAYRGRHDDSDSEGSVPPRSRVSHTRSKRSSSTSSSSSEDLGSSTDDERRCRDIGRKKWLTGSLAAVATIHAAAKVYSSLEARDKRRQKVLAGELSPEEERKQRNRGKWQDAAAVGVAALGIRGAMGEWHEVEEKSEEHKKFLKEREERHRKRMEKQKRLLEGSRGGSGPSSHGSQSRDDGHRQRAIKDHGEYDKHRSKSMSTHDDDRDSRALVRSKSRRRSDE